MSQANRVRILQQKDVEKAAGCLLKAFESDSLAQLLTCHVSTAYEKQKINRHLYEAYLRQHILKGICLGIGESKEEFETVAIWSKPTSYDEGIESFDTLMESGYGKLWEIAGAAGRDKIFNGMLPLLHDTCTDIMTSDARFADKGVYTLVYVGSVASARGKGNTRAMFDFMFKNYIDVDGEDNITYLESSSPDNIPIYERFGFHFYRDIVLGDKSRPDAVEGTHYAVMNVMIRDTRGKDWTTAYKTGNSSESLYKL